MNKLFFGTGKCPICEAIIRYKAFVIVSPWVREKIKTKKKLSQMAICESCTGAVFSFRYNQTQIKELYQNYRDENYNQLRYKWEKWYGNKYQKGHHTKEYIEGRKKELAFF
jgi:hypothetical protein